MLSYWIPGWAADQRVFDNLIQSLGSAYRKNARRFDFPRSVESERAGNEKSYCAALVAGMEISGKSSRGVDLVGWSMGALTALETAAAGPERVRSLVLISACACFLKGPGNPHGKDRRILQLMKRRLENDPRGLVADFQRGMFPPGQNKRGEDFQRKLGVHYLELEPAYLAPGLDYLAQTDLRSALPAIACPALVLHAADDTVIDYRLGEALAGALPRASFVLLENGGHLPFWGAGRKFAGLIGEFWERVSKDG